MTLSYPTRRSSDLVVENEARAREVADYRQEQINRKRTTAAPTTFEHMFSALNDKVIEYPVGVKGDVQGSVEAIVSSLNKASTDEIKARVLHSEIGRASCKERGWRYG